MLLKRLQLRQREAEAYSCRPLSTLLPFRLNNNLSFTPEGADSLKKVKWAVLWLKKLTVQLHTPYKAIINSL